MPCTQFPNLLYDLFNHAFKCVTPVRLLVRFSNYIGFLHETKETLSVKLEQWLQKISTRLPARIPATTARAAGWWTTIFLKKLLIRLLFF
jgi:hypothetical protein